MAPAPRPTRRALLLAAPAAAGLAVLTSCTSGSPSGPPTPSAAPDPDLALRAAAVAREQELIRAYDAALLAVPTLRDRLLVLRAEHQAHLGALGAAPASPAVGSPLVGEPTGSPTGTTDAHLAGLRSAERVVGSAHTAGLRTASAALAVVLATLAASEAAHEVALG